MSTAARIDELRKKFDENPRRYFAPLANEYRKAGELALAIALCREHLPKQPGHMSGHIVFGQALFEQAMQQEGEQAASGLAEARSVFESALALDPENLIALRHLGDIAKATGDAPAARRWYERVLDADPRNDDIAAQLATLATGLTPPSVPAVGAAPVSPAMPTPAAGSPGVPGFAMPPLPTPDAAMRAVDFDAVNRQIARFTPLDLDAMDASDPAPPSLAPSAPSEHEPVAAREADDESHPLPSAPLPPLEIESRAMTDAGAASDDAANVTDADQPVQSAFDMLDAPSAPASHAVPDDVPAEAELEQRDAPPASDESFEEGLIAPEWPDTTPFVTRLQTPRAATPATVPVLDADDESASPEASDDRGTTSTAAHDAAEAFGREPHERTVLAPEPEPPVSLEGGESTQAPVIPVEAEADDAAESMPSAEAHDVDRGADADAVSPPTVDAVQAADPQADDARSGDARSDGTGADETRADVTERDESPVSSDDMAVVSAEEEPETHADAVGRPVSAELDAIADAIAADARDIGEPDDVVVSEYEPPVPTESAFADVHPDVDEQSPTQHVMSASEPDAAVFVDEVDEADAQDDAHVAMSAASPSPAFVTETMGELLVSQGFIDRAVDVYEELVRRRPYDPVLSSRLDELRARVAETAAPAQQIAARSATPRSVTPASVTPASFTPASFTPASSTPAYAPAMDAAEQGAPTARELFARLAARRVPRRTPPQSTPAVRGAAAESGEANLSALFGSVPSESHDDSAARALADAFAPLSPQELSGQALDNDFARAFLSPESAPSAPFAAVPPRPSSVSTTTSTPTPRGGAFSFDRFFPDPATPSAPSSSPSAVSGTSAAPDAGSSAGAPPADQRTAAPVDDLAEFSAWLKGLGKS